MTKVYLKNILTECKDLHEEVYSLIKTIFKDKSTEETLIALMLLSTVFEDSVEKHIGVEDTKKIKDYIIKHMNM